MNSDRAEYIRDVANNEPEDQIVEDAKVLTLLTSKEHAVLRLRGGRRVLVRGGSFGIELDHSMPNDPFGREPNRLYVAVDDQAFVIERLDFHVHPLPTGGPSDEDLFVLKLLRQDDSVLYELFGPPEGTTIRPKSRGVVDGT